MHQPAQGLPAGPGRPRVKASPPHGRAGPVPLGSQPLPCPHQCSVWLARPRFCDHCATVGPPPGPRGVEGGIQGIPFPPAAHCPLEGAGLRHPCKVGQWEGGRPSSSAIVCRCVRPPTAANIWPPTDYQWEIGPSFLPGPPQRLGPTAKPQCPGFIKTAKGLLSSLAWPLSPWDGRECPFLQDTGSPSCMHTHMSGCVCVRARTFPSGVVVGLVFVCLLVCRYLSVHLGVRTAMCCLCHRITQQTILSPCSMRASGPGLGTQERTGLVESRALEETPCRSGHYEEPQAGTRAGLASWGSAPPPRPALQPCSFSCPASS